MRLFGGQIECDHENQGMLEQTPKNKISEGLWKFFSLVPQKVRICAEQFPRGRYVSIKQLSQGDAFLTEEGDILTADGIVTKGSTVIDESSITGEAKPANVRPQDMVKSGTQIISGKIQVKAVKVGDESILGRMLAIMENNLSEKTAQTQRFKDLLKFFVPSVIGFSVVTYFFWLFYGLTFYLTYYLISGDAERPTLAAGTFLQIPAEHTHGGLLPHEKAEFIKTLKQSGKRVAMVGDGVNDAPAMGQSDIAMAVHSGLNPGEGVAAITLMQEIPVQIIDFIALAIRVNRKVKQNLIFALVYNIISIPVAAGGFLNPIIAATAMLLSCLSVTCNTLLLVKRESKNKPVR